MVVVGSRQFDTRVHAVKGSANTTFGILIIIGIIHHKSLLKLLRFPRLNYLKLGFW